MEDLGGLNLRRMSQVREVARTHVREAARGFLSELRIIAQSRAYRGWRRILAEGSRILVADNQQNRHSQVTKFVEHRLRVDHVREQCRIPRDQLPPRTAVQSSQH